MDEFCFGAVPAAETWKNAGRREIISQSQLSLLIQTYTHGRLSPSYTARTHNHLKVSVFVSPRTTEANYVWHEIATNYLGLCSGVLRLSFPLLPESRDASTNTRAVSLTSTDPVERKQLHKLQNSTESPPARDKATDTGENCSGTKCLAKLFIARRQGSLKVTTFCLIAKSNHFLSDFLRKFRKFSKCCLPSRVTPPHSKF